MHWPSVTFGHLNTPFLYSNEILNEASFDKLTLLLYIDRLHQLDREIGRFISYLKETDQYENTLLIITGDHGSYLSPWGYKERYAFYERRIRVPLIIKFPNWTINKPEITNKPQQATISIMPTVLNTLGLGLPEYFQSLPQTNMALNGISITETLMHPKKEDYAITMISDEIKYVMFSKINWKNYTIDSIEDERLYLIDIKTGFVNENQEVAHKNELIVKKFRILAINFLEKNLDFQNQYPATNFRTGEIGWEPSQSGFFKKNISKLKKAIF